MCPVIELHSVDRCGIHRVATKDGPDRRPHPDRREVLPDSKISASLAHQTENLSMPYLDRRCLSVIEQFNFIIHKIDIQVPLICHVFFYGHSIERRTLASFPDAGAKRAP